MNGGQKPLLLHSACPTQHDHSVAGTLSFNLYPVVVFYFALLRIDEDTAVHNKTEDDRFMVFFPLFAHCSDYVMCFVLFSAIKDTPLCNYLPESHKTDSLLAFMSFCFKQVFPGFILT